MGVSVLYSHCMAFSSAYDVEVLPAPGAEDVISIILRPFCKTILTFICAPSVVDVVH